ncbi:hypothetical protein TrST_g7312 [Triparma strigata]|uniref:Uncharacterized protein n=1 Tax=Triparma strigata TaxID=1606541 RepID=A0A9W7BTG3_9STRA|nr:hypothetical protein TrST_g7312 [Triparma strigata]
MPVPNNPSAPAAPPPPAPSVNRPTYSTTARNLTATSGFLAPSSTTYSSLSNTLAHTSDSRVIKAISHKMNDLVDKSGSERVLKRVSKARKYKNRGNYVTTRRNVSYDDDGNVLDDMDGDSDHEEMSKKDLLTSIGIHASHASKGVFVPDGPTPFPPASSAKENIRGRQNTQAARMFFSAGMVMKDKANLDAAGGGRKEPVKMTALQKLQAASSNTTLAKFKRAAKVAVPAKTEEKLEPGTTRGRSKTGIMIDQMKMFSEQSEKQRAEKTAEAKEKKLREKMREDERQMSLLKSRLSLSSADDEDGGEGKVRNKSKPKVSFGSILGRGKGQTERLENVEEEKIVRVVFNEDGTREVVRSPSPITSPKKEKFVGLRGKPTVDHRNTKMLQNIREGAKKEFSNRKEVKPPPVAAPVAKKVKRLARAKLLIDATKRLSDRQHRRHRLSDELVHHDHEGREYEEQEEKPEEIHSATKTSNNKSGPNKNKDGSSARTATSSEPPGFRKPCPKRDVEEFLIEINSNLDPNMFSKLCDLPSAYVPLALTVVSLGGGLVRMLDFVETRDDCKLVSTDYTRARVNEIVEQFASDAEGNKVIVTPEHPYTGVYKSFKDGKVVIKGLKTLDNVRDAITMLCKNGENAGAGCVQRFIKCKGNVPEFARVVLERTRVLVQGVENSGRWKTNVKGVILKSKLPYLSNVNCHLDGCGVGPSGFECLSLGGEDFDCLKGEILIVARQLEKAWGGSEGSEGRQPGTFKVERMVVDWSMGEDGEWNINSFLDLRGVLLKDGEGGTVPSWAYEVKEKKVVKKLKCEGDFCDVPGGGRCYMEPEEAFTVLGRSLVKSKQDRGVEVPSLMLRPAKMNQGHKVCKVCHDEYVQRDMVRMVRAREMLEREEQEQKEKERKKNKKEKGWKSRMQLEYEAKLVEEKEKVRLLMLKKKQAAWKIAQQVKAKAQGVDVNDLEGYNSSSSESSEEGGEMSFRAALKEQQLKMAKMANKSDGDDSSSSDSESSEDEAIIAKRKAEKKELHEIRQVERAEKSKIRAIQTKVMRMRRVTDAFTTNHSPSKLKEQMKKKVEEAKRSFKERRQSMANSTTTFSKVMLLLKNKRALEGAHAGGGLSALREGEEDEEESEDEEDDEVGENIRKSIIDRATSGNKD